MIFGGLKARLSGAMNGRETLKPSRLTVPIPVLGYKRAKLLDASCVGAPFRGVGAKQSYSWLDETVVVPKGFHAYSSMAMARLHGQRGNCYLEVALSGEVRFHEDGAVGSRQRVLQLVVGECGRCRAEQASHWTKSEVPWAPLEELKFLCQDCTSGLTRIWPLRGLQSSLVGTPFPLKVSTLYGGVAGLKTFSATHVGVMSL